MYAERCGAAGKPWEWRLAATGRASSWTAHRAFFIRLCAGPAGPVLGMGGWWRGDVVENKIAPVLGELWGGKTDSGFGGL